LVMLSHTTLRACLSVGRQCQYAPMRRCAILLSCTRSARSLPAPSPVPYAAVPQPAPVEVTHHPALVVPRFEVMGQNHVGFERLGEEVTARHRAHSFHIALRCTWLTVERETPYSVA
jgi:hypothetical protein